MCGGVYGLSSWDIQQQEKLSKKVSTKMMKIPVVETSPQPQLIV